MFVQKNIYADYVSHYELISRVGTLSNSLHICPKQKEIGKLVFTGANTEVKDNGTGLVYVGTCIDYDLVEEAFYLTYFVDTIDDGSYGARSEVMNLEEAEALQIAIAEKHLKNLKVCPNTIRDWNHQLEDFNLKLRFEE